ncbi:hypothetical protein EV424DRAFT_1544123 [Suillus variegatus]|nr:hypothetical protein EV424DRAFT_1544123 [Suillus variegatus]
MANTPHASTVSWPLHVYGITVDSSKSKPNIESVEVRTSKYSPIELEHEAGKRFRRTFSKPTVLSQGDTFSLHLRCKTWLGMKTEHQDIPFNRDVLFRVCHARQGYNKVHKKISIFVNLSETEQSTSSATDLELRPTASEIFQKCPRFQILVIGKPGVGKSSLIDHIFKMEKMIVAQGQHRP